jgi:adenosylcobyric acid synthase
MSESPWIILDDERGTHPEGAVGGDDRSVLGTSLHGLFEADGFRAAFLASVAARRGKAFAPSGVSFAAAREAQFDRLADLVEAHLDMAAIEKLIAAGVPADASGERPGRPAADRAARPTADRSPLAVRVPNPEYP